MPHKDGFKPVLSIVVPVYNQGNMTANCFSNIRHYTKVPYEIVWVDNGSKDEDFKIVHRAATKPKMHTKLVKLGTNTGFVKATNQGILNSEGDYVILLNNDCFVYPGWDEKLIHPLKTDETVGAVGPVTQSRIAWQEVHNLNTRWKLGLPTFSGKEQDCEKFAKTLETSFNGKYIDIGKLPLAFFCVAMKRSLFDHIGLLDEDFGIGLGDDDEFSFRIKANGYKLMLSLGTFIYHKHRTTFKALSIGVDSLRRRNVKILKEKKKNFQPIEKQYVPDYQI